MTNKYSDEEFSSLIKDILDIKEFQKTIYIKHHGITRYEHSLRVAYISYRITKFLRLNYKETTEAALLHDFFIDELDNKNKASKLINHPNVAVENASKYIELTDRQVDIIKTHMFPITFEPPKYLESWIVDIADDLSAIYEKIYSIRMQLLNTMKEASLVGTFFFVLLLNIVKPR